jgi:hypothetical protein
MSGRESEQRIQADRPVPIDTRITAEEPLSEVPALGPTPAPAGRNPLGMRYAFFIVFTSCLVGGILGYRLAWSSVPVVPGAWVDQQGNQLPGFVIRGHVLPGQGWLSGHDIAPNSSRSALL